MELIWKETEVSRLIFEDREQLKVEGELPSPDGRRASSVLLSGAKIALTETAAEKDAVRITGRIIVNVTALDEEGTPFSFESGADFTHLKEAEGVSPGMTVRASACVQTLTVTPSDQGARLDAGIDLDIKAVSSVPLRSAAGVRGLDDLEVKTVKSPSSKKIRVGSEVKRLREELAAEGVAEVIWAEGFAAVRDISPEQGGSTVSGMICVSAVTVDGAGELGQLVRQTPFREHIGISADVGAVCEAEMKSVYVRALGEDFDILSMEAEIVFTVSRAEQGEAILPADAFSPTESLECAYEDVIVLNETGVKNEQITLKESIPLPENAPEPEAPVCVGVRPIITSVDTDMGAPAVSGVLVTEIVYKSTAGRLSVFSEDVPFSAAVSGVSAAEVSDISALSIGSAVGISDRSIQVQYSLKLTVDEVETVKRRTVIGFSESDREKLPSGIAILFASEGEDVFDAAKRLGVSCETLRRLNPGISEPFNEGERLIVIR
jgi:hypothetical protein